MRDAAAFARHGVDDAGRAAGHIYTRPVSEASAASRVGTSWRGTSAAGRGWRLRERLGWARRFRGLVAGEHAGLCRLMEEEVGKPAWEAFTADILPVLAACRWCERRAGALLRPRAVGAGGLLGMGKRVRVHRAAAGDVGLIATWNYPVGLLGQQLVHALVAGNRVVVKPSEHAPKSQARLLELAQAARLPDGVLRSVEATREAGRAMLANHRFDHVVFTGSTEVGRAVAETLAPRLTPSTLELSGRDSAIVLRDADAKVAARSIWFAVESNGGQTCMAPRRALVCEGVYDAFCRELGLLAAGAGPRRLIDAGAAERAFGLAQAACRAGGRSLTGVLEPPRGAWMRPVAVLDCPADAELVEGRHFGPALAVVCVRGEAEAVEVHRRCTQHLATSVFTRRPGPAARRLAPVLGATSVTFNDAVLPTAHPGAAIGGVGESGWGLSQGEAGFLAMTRPVYVSVTGGFRPPIEPLAASQAAQVAKWATRMYGGGANRTAASGGRALSAGPAPASAEAPAQAVP